MKIGIINTSTESSPLAKTFEMLCKLPPHENIETQIYQSDQFNPTLIKQDNIDYILMYGATPQDDGLAKAIHKHSPIPFFYYLLPGYGEHEKRYHELDKSGIEVYFAIKTETMKGSEDLIERLRQLGEHP